MMNASNLCLNRIIKFMMQHKMLWCITIFLVHLIAFVLSLYISFICRFDYTLSHEEFSCFLGAVPWVLAVKLSVFYLGRHFKERSLYASTGVLVVLVRSSFIAFLIIVLFNQYQQFLWDLKPLPRSIPLLDFGISIMLLGGLRLLLRMIREDIVPLFEHRTVENAYLIGANHEGEIVAGNINKNKNSGYRIIGFITIHDYKLNAQLGRIPIIGILNDLAMLARINDIQTIFVVAGVLPGSVFRNIFDICHKNGLKLQVISNAEFTASSKIPLREINIDDLLKRDPIHLDLTRIGRLITGRRVLITGAGGSIGSEICRQLIKHSPKEMILLGRGENRIFFLERELRDLKTETILSPIIADVARPDRMAAIFEQYQPEVVFHAAANKHVPLMEQNVVEAVRTNIYGTKTVADLAVKYGVNTFVLISTDKAVNPTSVMGVSKHLAERYVCSLGGQSKTKFIVTRFGNVLGSNGSVVPIFKKQIENGGPITITDERMTRFFMTIPEASQLVLDAAAMGQSGELFILEMGKSVKIVELAKDMIRLAGLPENSIDITYTGIRPGEKLYEEVTLGAEHSERTDNPKLLRAWPKKISPEEATAQVQSLVDLINEKPEKILARFLELVPEFRKYAPDMQNTSDKK